MSICPVTAISLKKHACSRLQVILPRWKMRRMRGHSECAKAEGKHSKHVCPNLILRQVSDATVTGQVMLCGCASLAAACKGDCDNITGRMNSVCACASSTCHWTHGQVSDMIDQLHILRQWKYS